MTTTRREFLDRMGMGLAAATGGALAAGLVPREAAAAILESRSKIEYRKWSVVRSQFDLKPELTHLSGLLMASHPRPVRQAIERHRRELDLDPATYIHERIDELDAGARQAAGTYLGVGPGQIALTDSTTMGLGLIYSTIDVKADQEILTTAWDHWSTQTSLRLRAERTGAKVRRIQVYTDPSTVTEDALVEAIVGEIGPKTRVVAITWVHSFTGVKLPIARIGERISKLNLGRGADTRILYVVDGVHGFGVENLSFPEMGADFFIAGCHKWIFGPRGTGLICGKADAWQFVSQVIPPFAFKDKSPGAQFSPGGYHSFEHRWALKEAFEFHLAIGPARIAERIHAQSTELKKALAKLPKVKLHTPMAASVSAGINCFDVAGYAPEEVVKKMKERAFVLTASPPTPSVPPVRHARMTPGVFNTEEEIRRAAGAVGRL